MIIDIDPLALAYIRAREKAHAAPPGATGGAGGPHMALHRADGAWQAIGCRVLAVAPETPASDLVGLAAHYQTTAPPKPRARSCTACEKYIPGGAMWDCPGEAMIWAEDVANMESDATEWPDGVPACPAFRVRA